MDIKMGTVVVTEGPGAPWRGRLRGWTLETDTHGQPIYSVILTGAWPESQIRTDVLKTRVKVLAWSIAEAVVQEVR